MRLLNLLHRAAIHLALLVTTALMFIASATTWRLESVRIRLTNRLLNRPERSPTRSTGGHRE